MNIFGHKPEINVTLNYDVMMKCKGVTYPVQADSACTKPKISTRNELMQNPDLSKILSPGMMKNLEMLKNMDVGTLRNMSREQMQNMSDEAMRNTPREQINAMSPKAEDMPGP